MLILEPDKTEHDMAALPPGTPPTLRDDESVSTQTEPFPDLPVDDELADYYSGEQLNPETIKPNPGPARPTHYLCRGAGRFVPMVALDELPTCLEFVNVPMNLSFKDIVDVGGTPCMPAVERAGQNYVVTLGLREPNHAVVPGQGERNHAAVEIFAPTYPESINVPSSDTINVCHINFDARS